MSDNDQGKACATCRYRGEPIKDVAERPGYQCRRHAPKPAYNLQVTRWPHVMADDWCGEYQPREDG